MHCRLVGALFCVVLLSGCGPDEFQTEQRMINSFNATDPFGAIDTLYPMTGGDYTFQSDEPATRSNLATVDFEREGRCPRMGPLSMSDQDPASYVAFRQIVDDLYLFTVAASCEANFEVGENGFSYAIARVESGNIYLADFKDDIIGYVNSQRPGYQNIDISTDGETVRINDFDTVRRFVRSEIAGRSFPREAIAFTFNIPTSGDIARSRISEMARREEQRLRNQQTFSEAFSRASESAANTSGTLRVCNETPAYRAGDGRSASNVLSHMIGYYDIDLDSWVSAGWYNIDNGECIRLNMPDRYRNNIYIAGRLRYRTDDLRGASDVLSSLAAIRQRNFDIEGTYELCFEDTAFRIHGNRQCVSRGYRIGRFQQIEINASDDTVIEVRPGGRLVTYAE